MAKSMLHFCVHGQNEPIIKEEVGALAIEEIRHCMPSLVRRLRSANLKYTGNAKQKHRHFPTCQSPVTILLLHTHWLKRWPQPDGTIVADSDCEGGSTDLELRHSNKMIGWWMCVPDYPPKVLPADQRG